MKSLRSFSLSAICCLAFSALTFAQSKTETFKVNGNCGMCKSKIEKAAKSGGAKSADWNKDTKELTVIYSSTSTNTAKIQQKIAAVGYDNVGFTAKTEAYNKLDECCKYDRAAMTKKMSCCDASCDMSSGKCDMEKCKEKGCCKDMEACKSNGCCGNGDKTAKMDCSKDGKGGDDCCKKKE